MTGSISFIGAGNLATSLAVALHKCGINIRQIYSRTMQSAETLAEMTDAIPINDIRQLEKNDIYIVSLKDSAMKNVICQIPDTIKNGIFVHTSGSIGIDVWTNTGIDNNGVIYPLQTFSKARIIDFKSIPVLLEASSAEVMSELRKVMEKVSDNLYKCNSRQRESIHLAAVFACNFSNHMYAVANHILENCGMDMKLLYPLIDETAEKIKNIPPAKAQTGPAARNDTNIINKHLSMLNEQEDLKEIYELMTKHIQQWGQ